MLTVGIVAQVLMCQQVQVRLIILVKAVAHLEVLLLRDTPVHLQPVAEVAIALMTHLARLPLAEEITQSARQRQVVAQLPDKAFLHVVRASAIGGQRRVLAQIQRLCTGHLEGSKRVQFTHVEIGTSAVAPLLGSTLVTGVEIGAPRV